MTKFGLKQAKKFLGELQIEKARPSYDLMKVTHKEIDMLVDEYASLLLSSIALPKIKEKIELRINSYDIPMNDPVLIAPIKALEACLGPTEDDTMIVDMVGKYATEANLTVKEETKIQTIAGKFGYKLENWITL
ncbi:MAG: hypothetical protein KJ697_00105 [Nanoarchaeota archaeon]|nr:hypothetical protein [Nanoarchaeota archaeon]